MPIQCRVAGLEDALSRVTAVFSVDKEYEMSNSEEWAYQQMLRQCEESLFGGDVQDDDETEQECE